MRTFWSCTLVLFLAAPVAAQRPLPEEITGAIPEAFHLLDRVGDEVWPGWGSAPSQLLLVGDAFEYFMKAPKDGGVTWTRKRIFPPRLQATFPAVDGVPTIVIGTAAGTGTPRDRWILTVLHEHFHQLQYSRPDYYDRLNALDLARGDTTGMWALNYAFPYDSAPIQAAVRRWADLMHAALAGPPRDRASGGARAREAKRALVVMLSPDDRRYLNFQLWQEGVPRWIELEAARRGESAGLISVGTHAWQERRLVDDLTRVDLQAQRREVVYALGAAEAELMNWVGSGWKEGYFERMFVLGE
jgi:hypothetical protein